MDEIEELSVEAVPGARPPDSTGDRLIVALASMALLGGVLIAGANLLDAVRDDPVAAASPGASPQVTAQPSRTPRPTRTPRPLEELTVQPASLPTMAPWAFETSVYGWLEATAELLVRSGASHTAEVIDRLAPGEVTLAFNDSSTGGADGWLRIEDYTGGGTWGWASLRAADGLEAAVFHQMDSSLTSGGIQRLAAGPHGYLAVVWRPNAGFAPPAPFMASSTDGERWRIVETDLQLLAGNPVLAWGPSGWIGISHVEGANRMQPWIWESGNGSDWASVGYVELPPNHWANDLVGSSQGYMLAMEGDSARSGLWYSPDGLTWQESATPFDRQAGGFGWQPSVRLLATEHGFVAWSPAGDGATVEVAVSRNGRSWTAIPLDGDGVAGFHLAAADRTLVAIGQHEDGSRDAWSADLLQDAPQFSPADRLVLGLDGLGLLSLIPDGPRMAAIAIEQDSGAARLLSSDGRTWRSEALPPDFKLGADLNAGVSGPAGLVLVGARPTSAGDNPVLWHRSADGTWAVEADPIVPLVPDPTAGECGEPPASAVRFSVLEPARAIVCFGSAEMTFRAWSARCDWCGDDVPVGIGSPPWLMARTSILQLTPVEGLEGWWREAVVHPDLGWEDGWAGTWLTVTGHYADPASEDCRWDPASGEAGWYYGMGTAAVTYCREQFVVTRIRAEGRPASPPPSPTQPG